MTKASTAPSPRPGVIRATRCESIDWPIARCPNSKSDLLRLCARIGYTPPKSSQTV